MNDLSEGDPAPLTDDEVRRRTSSRWTLKQRAMRVVWMFVQATLFRYSFHNMYGWRRWLLRRFGARVGAGVIVRPTVRIEIPWNLTLGEYCSVGDFAILYALGPITIGRLATVSQYAHLCAGTHDYRVRTFPLMRLPITIGEECWVGANAFVGPNVMVGDRAIVGATATITKNVPPNEIWVGNPARFVRIRPAELPEPTVD